MGDLTKRNLDDDRLQTAEFLRRADALAATTSGTRQTDSAILIREDRDR